MDKIAALINEFKAEDTDGLADPDSSNKVSIIARLEDIRDARVLPFLLSVAGDPGEYDLARIEVFKVLRLLAAPGGTRAASVAAVIRDVLLRDQDDDVRKYAAMATSNFFSDASLRDAVEAVVTDPKEDRDVRWNCFGTIERAGRASGAHVIERLVSDPEFGAAAQRLIQNWKSAD